MFEAGGYIILKEIHEWREGDSRYNMELLKAYLVTTVLQDSLYVQGGNKHDAFFQFHECCAVSKEHNPEYFL